MPLISPTTSDSLADIFVSLWFHMTPEKREATLADLEKESKIHPFLAQLSHVLLLTDAVVVQNQPMPLTV